MTRLSIPTVSGANRSPPEFRSQQGPAHRLLSIKTGGCPEDCGYCSQSAHHETGLKASSLMEVKRVIAEATKVRDAGATRYCMGAAWRNPKPRDMHAVVAIVEGVKALGTETCMTLGILDLAGRSSETGWPRLLQSQHRPYSDVRVDAASGSFGALGGYFRAAYFKATFPL